jgi:hypothetical protein
MLKSISLEAFSLNVEALNFIVEAIEAVCSGKKPRR